jgi:hypothetical protein
MPDAHPMPETSVNTALHPHQESPEAPLQSGWTTGKSMILLGATLLGLGFLGALNAGSISAVLAVPGMLVVICALLGLSYLPLAVVSLLIMTLGFFGYAQAFPYEDVSLFGSVKNLEAYLAKPMPWHWGCLLLSAGVLCMAPAFTPRTRHAPVGVIVAAVLLLCNAIWATPILYRSVSMRDVTTYVVHPALFQIDSALGAYAKAHRHLGYPPQDRVHDYATLRQTLAEDDQASLKAADHLMGLRFQGYKAIDTDGDGRSEDYELTMALCCPSYATCHAMQPRLYTLTSTGFRW